MSNGMDVESKKDWPPPSDDFVDTVTTGGGIVSDCELCGRTLFEDDERAGDWEPDELDSLRQKAEKEPDKYVGFHDRSVNTGHINGKQVVTNCPCNGLRSFENFIWSHRQMIADYIAKRSKRIAEEAYDDEGRAEFLQENAAREDVGKEFAKCQDCGGYFDKNSLDDRSYCPRCTDMHPPEDGDGESSFEKKDEEVNAKISGLDDDIVKGFDNVPF